MLGGTDENVGFSGRLGSSSGQQQFVRERPTPGRLLTCPQPMQQQPPATEAETAAQKSATYAKASRPAPAVWKLVTGPKKELRITKIVQR